MNGSTKVESAVGVDRAALADAFNDAYSIYPIPMSITRGQLDFLLRHRNFDPALSAVIRSPAGRIDAFWLTGATPEERPGETYAIALGVRPERLGAGLARAVFAHVRACAASVGFTSMTLEVIETNDKARRLYDALGFTPTRRVQCFRSRIRVAKRARTEIAAARLEDALSFIQREAAWTPTWPNAAHALANIEDDLDIRVAIEDGACVAAGVFSRTMRAIAQLATARAWRRRGYASAIVSEWAYAYGDIPFTVLNVDIDAQADLAFYRSCGLEPLLIQLEMTAPLASLGA